MPMNQTLYLMATFYLPTIAIVFLKTGLHLQSVGKQSGRQHILSSPRSW